MKFVISYHSDFIFIIIKSSLYPSFSTSIQPWNEFFIKVFSAPRCSKTNSSYRFTCYTFVTCIQPTFLPWNLISPYQSCTRGPSNASLFILQPRQLVTSKSVCRSVMFTNNYIRILMKRTNSYFLLRSSSREWLTRRQSDYRRNWGRKWFTAHSQI